METSASAAAGPSRSPQGNGVSRIPDFWRAALIFLLALAAYAPAYKAGFIWNDEDYVTKPVLRTLRGLWRVWFEIGATQQYYPALHSAFWFEHRLWGDAPLGYHLINVLLHAAAAWIFVLILRRLAVPGAYLAGLLFALHPVCVETVAWVSEQKNTLSTVFYLLAALTYLGWRDVERADERDRQRDLTPSYFLATLFFILAVASKSEAATLPAALLVVVWWKRGRLSWRADAAPLLPWFGVAAAGGAVTAWVERTYIGARGAEFDLGLAQRFLVAGRAVCFYLGKLFWPADLIFIYPRWQIDPAAAWQYLFPLGALTLVGVLWLIRGRTRAPLAAALIFIGSLFPILGFFNVFAFRFSFVADHFLYLASLGVIAFVSAGWGIWARRAPGAAACVAVAVLCVLGALTWRQSRMYRDIETFYRVTLDRNFDAWMAHNNLGILLDGSGRSLEAIGHFEQALRARPNFSDGHNNMGVALTNLRRPEEAIAQFREALRLDPLSVEAHLNLGNILRDTGRVREAIAEYGEALRIRPDSPEAYNNLGVAYAEEGRLADAIAQCRAALALNPDYAQAHYDLGLALRKSRNLPDAIAEYDAALKIRPDFRDARNNLGILLAETGHLEEAVAQFEEALRVNPNDGEIHANLAVVLQHMGRTQEAYEHIQEARRLSAAPGP